ncbi:hypothetical protein NP493_17g06059 [Ridgeia piscesae]|uniref:Uncharacterized protein n=1 Tax=Ridgeia piscesae TaxID=27915 RepID=A0AAD9PDZ5_RIDPI|nr:hypothetical protein NP493_17g06059 [Ridgeia piscesae]
MATPLRAGRRVSTENVSDLLSCSVCMEVFDDTDHLPKLLLCHHTFCVQCLIRLAKQNQFLNCPTCRHNTVLTDPPPGGLFALQTNFYIQQMRELIGDVARLKVKGCRKHSSAPLEYFCKTCEVLICKDCCSVDHRTGAGHVTQVVSLAAEEQKCLLRLEMAEGQQALISNRLYVGKLTAEIGCLTTAKDKAMDDIDKAFDRYIEVVNVRRRQLQDNLKDLYTYNSDCLQHLMDNIKAQSTSLAGLIEHCEEAIHSSNISDILAYKSKLSLKTTEVRTDRSKCIVGSNYLCFSPQESDSQYLHLVQDLGSVHMEQKLPSSVKLVEQTSFTASIFAKLVLLLHSFDGNPINDYPISIEIRDPFDDCLPNLVQYQEEGQYEVRWRPVVSGLHQVQVKFLDRCITGGNFTLTVKSNDPVSKIGGKGSEEGKMGYPRAVTVDRDDNVFVVDTGNNRIEKFDGSGTFQYSFEISSENDTYSSCGIALNRDHTVIICPEVCVDEADLASANAILQYTTDGELLSRTVCQNIMKRALSVAVDSRGHIIMADFELNTILAFDQNCRFLWQSGAPGVGPGEFNHPMFVCIGENDSIIVSDGDNHRIQVFDSSGKFMYKFGRKGSNKGEFNMPFGVTVDRHGNILVVDGSNRRIQIFKARGEFVSCIESLGDEMSAPRGIAVTSDGHVLVADRDNHCVKKYKYLHGAPL